MKINSHVRVINRHSGFHMQSGTVVEARSKVDNFPGSTNTYKVMFERLPEHLSFGGFSKVLWFGENELQEI